MAQIVGFYDVVGIQALPNQVKTSAARLPGWHHVGSARRRQGQKVVHFYDKNKWELLHSQTSGWPEIGKPRGRSPRRRFAWL